MGGCVEENLPEFDEDDAVARTGERLIYGWPGQSEDPVPARAIGRFARAFPLEFPMGIGDLFDDRPRRVSVQDWVQHLMRYRTGQFVGGPRGQRVMWAMVNVLLLNEARGKGFGVYRTMYRRAGLGVQGPSVMTKGGLRQILESEDRVRILVGQLANVGRDVPSTTMHWSYESKKLQSTVKHLSWHPPWVEGTLVDGAEPVGRRFLRELDLPAGKGRTQRGRALVPDVVGLGRHPSIWWTQNPFYNAAYDIQRMGGGPGARAAGDRALGDWVGDGREERFRFARDNPDLVAYMMALRVELNMRMVMPAVLPHSEQFKYMAMARAECGAGGNLHYHGFSVGLPGPPVARVRADVDGEGD